jgi:tetratricopeptide (TPR) repeat protein
MRWNFLLNYINRQRITLFIGFIVLLFGWFLPWYHLPTRAIEAFGTNLTLVSIIRILCIILTIFAIFFLLFFRKNRLFFVIFWIELVLIFFFPYLINNWSPTVNFIALDYYSQLQRVMIHIEANFAHEQANWKKDIVLQSVTPTQSIFPLVIQDSRFFQISSLENFIINGFGYKNYFLAFISGGWISTGIGLVITLIGLYLGKRENLRTFLRDITFILPIVALIITLIIFQFVALNSINYHLDQAFAKGEYVKVLNNSKFLITIYPTFKGDEAFLKRMGEASFYGQHPEESLILFIKGLEKYKQQDLLQAESYFQQSLEVNPDNFLVRGYLSTTLLQRGVNFFNARLSGAAENSFEKVLRIFPDNLETLYNLMLAKTINGQFEASALIAQKIQKIHQYFQLHSLALQGQTDLHLAWASYHKKDLENAWKYYKEGIGGS